MNKLILKLKAVWFLLRSNGYIIMASMNPLDEEFDVKYCYAGFDENQMILIADCFSEEIEEIRAEKEDIMVSEKLGSGMINYFNSINLN